MNDVSFYVLDAWPERHAAVPTLVFGLRVEESTGQLIHNIALRCQIRIEPQRRRYSHTEEKCLAELFGDPPRWGDTLKPFLWTHVSTMLPGFRGSQQVELAVPCSYDLEVTASKYFHALEDGEISLLLLFSGTIFAKGEHGLEVTQVAWDKEARHRLPVRVWRAMMDLYFPNSGWLRLQRETLDALTQFKARSAITTWDDVMTALLANTQEPKP